MSNKTQYTNQIRTMLNLKNAKTKRSREDFETVLIWLGVHANERAEMDIHTKMVIHGLIHTYNRGGLDGTYSIALRSLSAWNTTALIGELLVNCSTDDDVRQWLVDNRSKFVKDN